MKERLLGAAVLVAIAVWLIPWVLDGPESGVEAPGSSLTLPAAEEPMPMRTQTLRLGEPDDAPTAASPSAAAAEPARGEPEARDEPEPAAGSEPRAGAETAVAAARGESEQAAAVAAVSPPPKPEPAATPPKPAAQAGDWTVQLGSFSEEANARRLAQRAGTFGYQAQVSSYSSGGRTLYRVRVGPQRSRAEADAAASALKAHGLKDARVVPAR